MTVSKQDNSWDYYVRFSDKTDNHMLSNSTYRSCLVLDRQDTDLLKRNPTISRFMVLMYSEQETISPSEMDRFTQKPAFEGKKYIVKLHNPEVFTQI